MKFLGWHSSSRYNREKITGVINSPLRMHRVRKIKDLDASEVFNLDVQGNHNYFVFTKTFIPVLVRNCHGAGRVLSRSAAIRQAQNRSISRELEEKGIVVAARGRKTLAEEMPSAYKDVSEVVEVAHKAGISRKVCRMRPMGVIKG